MHLSSNSNKSSDKLSNKQNDKLNLSINLDFFAQNKYAIVENAVSTEHLQLLLKYVQKKYQEFEFKKAAIGRGTGEKISTPQRGDFILWLDSSDENEAVAYFLKFLDKIKQVLNTEFFLSLSDIESHVTVYPPGAKYEKHIDQFKSKSPLKKERKISFILYLNDKWQKGDGGELVLYSQDCPEQILLTVDPIWGRLIYFASDEFPHEVLTTCARDRISLTAWFLG